MKLELKWWNASWNSETQAEMVKNELNRGNTCLNVKVWAKIVTAQVKMCWSAEVQTEILSPSTFKSENASWTVKTLGHRLLFFCPLIHFLKAWFFNCNEKTWPKILFPILCFKGINFKTWFPPNQLFEFVCLHIRRSLMVIANYGMNFRPGLIPLWINFLKFSKWKMETPVFSLPLKK